MRISKFYQLSDRIGVIENLLVGLGGEAHKSSRSGAVYQKWLNEQIHEAITSPETAIRTAKDGAKLANIAKDLPSKEVFNT